MEKKRPFIRQSVAITGGKLDAFTRSTEQIEKVQVMLTAALPHGMVTITEPRTNGSHIILDFHTRFLTRTTLAPDAPRIPIERLIDPAGNLDAMQADGRFKHTQDNKVEFYRASTDTE